MRATGTFFLMCISIICCLLTGFVEAGAADSSATVPQERFATKVRPLAYIYQNAIFRVTNLQNKSDMAQNLTHPGYRIESWETVGGGLGLGLNGYFENASGLKDLLSGTLGILVVTGSQYLSNYYVPTEKMIDSYERKIPESFTDLNEWHKGDTMFYQSRGGVLLIANIGSGLMFNTGISHVVDGMWNTYVEKTDKNHAIVNLVPSRINTTRYYVGSTIVYGSSAIISDVGEGFTYEYDLNVPEAQEAFTNILHGNVQQSQDMLKDTPYMGVTKIADVERIIKGKTKTLFIGVPIFMNYRNMKGEFYNEAKADYTADGASVLTKYGIYRKAKTGRFMNRHSNIDEIFTGGIATVTDKSGKVMERALGGTFMWSYEKDHGLRESLPRILENFYASTLFDDFTYDYRIPKPVKIKTEADPVIVFFDDDYGFDYEETSYMRVLLEVSLSSEMVKGLMGNYASKNGSGALTRISLENLAASVIDGRGSNKGTGGKASKTPAYCANRAITSFEACSLALKKRVTKTLTQLSVNVAEMAKSFTQSEEEFAQSFREFGKVVWSNEYVFKAFSESVKKCGGEINFEVSGREIPIVSESGAWNYDPKLCR